MASGVGGPCHDRCGPMVDGLGFSTALHSTSIRCECLQADLCNRADCHHIIARLHIWLDRWSNLELGTRQSSSRQTRFSKGSIFRSSLPEGLKEKYVCQSFVVVFTSQEFGAAPHLMAMRMM